VKHRRMFVCLLIAITIIALMAPAVFAADPVFFNVQLPVLGVDASLVDWKTKDYTTNGSYLGTSDEHFYLSNLDYVWIWTDVKFVNSGNVVRFSPKIKVYNNTLDNWLGGYNEFDPVAGDKIRLRVNHGLIVSPYSYCRAEWNFY
jgi:hypothetical protein